MKQRWTSLSLVVVILFYLCSFYPAKPAAAQSPLNITIDGIRNQEFPHLVAPVSVLGRGGYPITGLTKENFSISDDGQVVQDFTISATRQLPLAIVVLIDTSKTMEYGEAPTPMENILASAKDFIASLPVLDRIAVISFSDDITIVQDLSAERDSVLGSLDTLTPVGNTALNDALVEAVGVLEDSPERRVVLLITDGIDSGISDSTFEDAMGEITAHNIIAHTIAWNAANTEDLNTLAELSRGTQQFLAGPQPDLQAFQAAFASLDVPLQELREQYLVQYTSNLPADGAEHELVVAVDHQGQHAETSRHFVATPNAVLISIPGYQDGQVVSGPVHFTPEITAPAEVGGLNIFIDGTPLTSVNSSPFEYTWNSWELLGNHKLTFVTTDKAGNQGETSLSLVVEPPVSVNFLNPKDGDTISGEAAISSQVTAETTVEKVEYYLDTQLLGRVDSPTNQNIYELQWDFSGVPVGSYPLHVFVEDTNGFTTEDEVDITVSTQQSYWMIIVVLGVSAGAIVFVWGRRRRQQRTAAFSAAGDKVPPGEVQGGAVLLELEGSNPEHAWALSTAEIRLGRKRSENDIPLKGLHASRKQAIIRYLDGQYVIVSLNPQNPILVNDIPIQKESILRAGDVIKAGDTVLRFEIQGAVE